ncbi:glutamyl/glutaminyl-tRNA synthetase [Catenulispora sp. EB89]
MGEVVDYVDFLFLSEPVHDEQSWSKAVKLVTGAPRTSKSSLEAVAAPLGLKMGKAQAPVRVATTGRTVGFPLFESLEALGRERTLSRQA